MSIGRTLILRNVPCSITTFSAPAGGSIFAPPADLKAEDELRHNAARKSSARRFSFQPSWFTGTLRSRPKRPAETEIFVPRWLLKIEVIHANYAIEITNVSG
jgi:hypothetical protein